MSKYNLRRRKKRILSAACYFIAFALLFGALVYLYKDNRNKKQERAVYKENLAQEESEEKLPEITTGEKKKEETVPSPTQTAEPTVTPTETPTPEPTGKTDKKSGAAAASTATVTKTAEATPTAEPTPTPLETEKLSILVLNGTRKQGVAGFWKGQLEAEGFTNVTAATYKKAVEAETVIYSETQDLERNTDIFKKLFPKAEFRQEGIKDGISFEANQAGQQESYDYYIVVGLSDARNK